MGGDTYLSTNPSDDELDEIRASLADKFDLILVADHLPESLILLRHQLCLSINDIASMSKNVAKRTESRIDLTDQINKWQTVDSVIFAEANRTLWERVEQFGLDRMRVEVEALTRRNKQLSDECVKSYRPVKQLPREFQDYEPPGVRIDGE
jgi:DNA polymerase III psi subunit